VRVDEAVAHRTAEALDDQSGERPVWLDLIDDRARDLIVRRRLGLVHRRGWLVRRALAAADLLGLTVAFLLASLLFTDASMDMIGIWTEVAVFVACTACTTVTRSSRTTLRWTTGSPCSTWSLSEPRRCTRSPG
jgi:hypothetical protein